MFRSLLKNLMVKSQKYEALFRKLYSPGGLEWAEILKVRGDFYSIGENCYIEPHAQIDRKFVRLGDNVRLANCTLLAHDGSVNMINRAFGLHLDNVGKIDIRDNVYIGYQVVILPGVTIGPNAIVSAGSVVRSDVAEGTVVAGVPAKVVGTLEMSVSMLKAKNERYPWKHIIEARISEFDPALEPELTRQRLEYFYGSDS